MVKVNCSEMPSFWALRQPELGDAPCEEPLWSHLTPWMVALCSCSVAPDRAALEPSDAVDGGVVLVLGGAGLDFDPHQITCKTTQHGRKGVACFHAAGVERRRESGPINSLACGLLIHLRDGPGISQRV